MATDKSISREAEAYDHWTTVTLRYSDQDAMGHINNVAVAAYFEAGRLGLFAHLFAGATSVASGMVLARLTIDYLAEMHFRGADPTVRVGGRLARVGGRSITTHYAAFQDERACAVSESVNVFFDPVTRRSAAPPDDVAARLEALMRA